MSFRTRIVSRRYSRTAFVAAIGFPATWLVFALTAGAALPAQAAGSDGAIRAVDLRCQGAVAPLGIDAAAPALSWKIAGDGRGLAPDGLPDPSRVAARSAEGRTSRISGTAGASIRTRRSASPTPAGPWPLSERVSWRVRVWDQDGRESAWSETSDWTMGVLRPEEWRAVWIGAQPGETPPAATRLLRREFRRPVASGSGRSLRLRTRLLRSHDQRPPGRRGSVGAGLDQVRQDLPLRHLRRDPPAASRGQRRRPSARQRLLQRHRRPLHQVQGHVRPAQGHRPAAPGIRRRVGRFRRQRTDPGGRPPARSPSPASTAARTSTPGSFRAGFDEPGFDDAGWAPAAVLSGPGGVLRGSAAAAPPHPGHRDASSRPCVTAAPARGRGLRPRPERSAHAPPRRPRAGRVVGADHPGRAPGRGRLGRPRLGRRRRGVLAVHAGRDGDGGLLPQVLLPRLPLSAGRAPARRRRAARCPRSTRWRASSSTPRPRRSASSPAPRTSSTASGRSSAGPSART